MRRFATALVVIMCLSSILTGQGNRSAGRGRSGGASTKAGSATSKPADEPLATFEGTVSGVDRKKILVDEQEGNTMEFYTTRKTRIYDGDKEIKSSQLKSGDRVRVEAQRHMDGTIDAVTVRLVKPQAGKS